MPQEKGGPGGSQPALEGWLVVWFSQGLPARAAEEKGGPGVVRFSQGLPVRAAEEKGGLGAVAEAADGGGKPGEEEKEKGRLGAVADASEGGGEPGKDEKAAASRSILEAAHSACQRYLDNRAKVKGRALDDSGVLGGVLTLADPLLKEVKGRDLDDSGVKGHDLDDSGVLGGVLTLADYFAIRPDVKWKSDVPRNTSDGSAYGPPSSRRDAPLEAGPPRPEKP
ncbi:hypothetical protein T484DRAFT_1815785 [Baffinella frigidus]|nr:hypothetical protein T484DRAFT_1815785 [Cryptophyta sp. CCMP2293]